MRSLQRTGPGVAAVVLLIAALTPSAAGDAVRVLPDDDLQEAIDAATEGGTLLLAPGNHRGPATISRRITVRGDAGARLTGNGQGSVLTIEADGVQVENLEIRGSGRDLSRDNAGVLVLGDEVRIANVHLRENLHGIYVRGARHVQLVNNHVVGLAATEDDPQVIGAEDARRADGVHHDSSPRTQSLMGNGLHLFNAEGAIVENNRIQHVRDGIYVAHTHRAVFRGNRIHESRYAIHYMYSSNNVIAGNELWRNVAGAALMFSRDLEVHDNVLRDHGGFRAYGLLLQNVDASAIRRNAIRGNRAGLRLQNSSANRFRDNRVIGNLAGMIVNSSSRDNAFTRNRIGPNLRQIELTGPPPPTGWSVEGVGNRWDGALPLDLTGDGISEWPHHEVDLMAERRETFPYVQLLIGSPGIRAVEWALSRAPIPGTRYITDPHPLTRERRGD
jgi:nitrous oxidase accessory protein